MIKTIYKAGTASQHVWRHVLNYSWLEVVVGHIHTARGKSDVSHRSVTHTSETPKPPEWAPALPGWTLEELVSEKVKSQQLPAVVASPQSLYDGSWLSGGPTLGLNDTLDVVLRLD